MKRFLLAAALATSLIAGTAHASNKPYVLVLEKVTFADWAKCRKDDNCMDIQQRDELPVRKEVFCEVDQFTGAKREFEAPMTDKMSERLDSGAGLSLGSCRWVQTMENTYCTPSYSRCWKEFDIDLDATEQLKSEMLADAEETKEEDAAYQKFQELVASGAVTLFKSHK